MDKLAKIDLIKNCIMANDEDLTNENWSEMIKGVGGKIFIDSMSLAMDMYFNKKASDLLQFERDYFSLTSKPIDTILIQYGIYTANKNLNK